MQGFLEKLPKGTAKKSFLTKWQRRYFKARDGELFYYRDHRDSRPLGFIRLRDSIIGYRPGNVIHIQDTV